MYNAKTTRIELRQIIDRLNAANAALRERNSQLEGDLAIAERNCEALSQMCDLGNPTWGRGPRPAAPAPASRDPGFRRRAETMRLVGASLAGVLGRPATRPEVLAEIERLASTN